MSRIESALADVDDTETIALIDAEYEVTEGETYVKNDIRAKEAP